MSENFFSRGAARQLMREFFPTKVAQPSLRLNKTVIINFKDWTIDNYNTHVAQYLKK